MESHDVTTGTPSVKTFLERKRLLSSARAAVASKLIGEEPRLEDVTADDRADRRGAFVSLHVNDELRGCVGVITSGHSLVETITAMAIGACCEDVRFEPLTLAELEHTRFEISLISPPVEITDVGRIVAGRDGVIVTSGRRRALLLPQVAAQIGGTVSDFLDAACRKAGLPAGAWRTPATKIETFTAEVFSDE